MSNGREEGGNERNFGCLQRCGLWLLIIVILLTLGYFFLKPALEQRGVDVDSKLEACRDQAENVKDKVSEYAQKGVEKARSAADKVSTQVSDRAAEIGDAAKEGGTKIKDMADDATESLEEIGWD